jgi:phosphatidate phosphatase APP1
VELPADEFTAPAPMVGDEPDGAPRWLDVESEAPHASGRARGRVALIGPRGWSVVSDLDDTRKITEVGDKSRALARTFVEPFESVAGMPDLCRRLAAKGAAFHYVSLSPWQLSAPLMEFLATEGFPEGALELQHFRLQDGEFADLVGDSRAKKLQVLEPLLARWPQRRFVLIGDSGQADAEVYAELARRRPSQIAAIWIRRTPPPGGEPKAESDAARVRELALQAKWSAAFAGLPDTQWRVFTDPTTLELPE